MEKFYLLFVDEIDADGAAYYGTKYDMKEACPQCGTGAISVGPRYMSGLEKIKKPLFFAGYGELIVDIQLAEKLKDIGTNNLVEVYSPKGVKRPFMEIRGEGMLPRFSELTTGYVIEKQCSVCKRDGYFDTKKAPLRLVYENVDRSLLNKNILITYERFGLSRLRIPFKNSVFARSRFIINGKVKSLFEQEKAKGLKFEPVTILSVTS